MPPKMNVMKQGVTPATLGTIRPGMQVAPISPGEADALNEVARQQGIDRAEALRRIAEKLPNPQAKQTVTAQSLDMIGKARELNLTSADPNDPLNQMMRYGFYKDLKKDMKHGDEERMNIREMMEMAILNKMLPSQDNGAQSGTAQQFQQIIIDLKSENEKQRQYYDQKLKDQEDKIRDMMFEKKFLTMQEQQEASTAELRQQLSDISQRLELYRDIPPNVTPEQKNDVISNLEDLGGQLERIRKAVAPFGILPSQSQPSSGAPSVPGTDQYKKPDGTVDYFRYSVDKLENTVTKITDAWQKKTPERKQLTDTPPPEGSQQTRQMTPEEYADYLLSKPSRAPQELEWLTGFQQYLEKQQAKLRTVQPYKPQQDIQPVTEPEFTGESAGEQPIPGETGRKSVIDKLKEQEEEEIRRSQGLI